MRAFIDADHDGDTVSSRVVVCMSLEVYAVTHNATVSYTRALHVLYGIVVLIHIT